MGDALSELNLSIQRGYIVESKIADCEKTVQSLETLIKMRDEQLMDLNGRSSKITMQQAVDAAQFDKRQSALESQIASQFSQMQIKVDSCLAFTQNFSTQLSQVNTDISNLVDGQSKQKSETLALKMMKLDQNEFEQKIQKFDEQLETVRFAVYDSFRVLKATDNYLEKYMPFMVQNLIS